MLVKLYGTPLDINVIKVYARTMDADEAECDRFYEGTDNFWRHCKTN